MREVLLVRHGEAHCNVAGVIASSTCSGLTRVGRHQADQLARRLLVEHSAGQPITKLFASSVRRAAETAHAVATLIGVDLDVEPDLRVPDPGPADGQSWEMLRRQYPPDPHRPTRPLIDGGESWRHYLGRAHAWLADLFHKHPGGRIVVVGHSETVTAALTWLAGAPALGALKVDPHPTGITRLTAVRERPHVPVTMERWALNTHNDTAHLHHRFTSIQDYST